MPVTCLRTKQAAITMNGAWRSVLCLLEDMLLVKGPSAGCGYIRAAFKLDTFARAASTRRGQFKLDPHSFFSISLAVPATPLCFLLKGHDVT